MVREVVLLPLLVKLLVVLGILALFGVITQWERLGLDVQWSRLTGKGSPPSSVVMSSVLTPPVERPSPRIPVASATDKTVTADAAAQALHLKFVAPMIIDDPIVQSDGSISGNGRSFYLYGIGPVDSKRVCTRASGERWACGLHAYAGLRNAVAHKKLVCNPREILPKGIRATCHLGAIDVALTLLREGLVELESDVKDPDLVNTEAFAQSRKLGIWDR
jgi:endonuclease YncB( thermonuclease family)